MIEFHPHALEELRQAQHWYWMRSVRAAERFYEQVNRALERLDADPVSHPTVGRRFKYVRIRKFPYLLIYEARSSKDVFIVAAAHTSRRSGYWNRRK